MEHTVIKNTCVACGEEKASGEKPYPYLCSTCAREWVEDDYGYDKLH